MSPTRKRLWLAVQALLACGIVAFVVRHFLNLLGNESLDWASLGDRWVNLIPAGLLYLAAHSIFGTFWWLLLRQSNIHIPWHRGVQTYFVSQFGKYVPGKAWVLVLRMGLLRHVPHASPKVVGLTGMYETLTTMAAGAMLAAAFLPMSGLGGEYLSGRGWILAGIAALPLGLFLLIRLLNRIARMRKGPDAQAILNSPLWLLVLGLLLTSVAWCLLTLSFRFTAAAVVPDWPTLSLDGFLPDLVCTTAAYVVGFIIVVAPGGLGPREVVLVELLRPQLVGQVANPASSAVFIALLLRLVWTSFEVIVAGAFYLLGHRRKVSITQSSGTQPV